MNRAEAIRKAMAECVDSKSAVDAGNKEWAIAHDAYNGKVTEQPPGRLSGTDIEFLRLQALASYEQLLDNMRIHRDNLAHLGLLKGKKYF